MAPSTRLAERPHAERPPASRRSAEPSHEALLARRRAYRIRVRRRRAVALLAVGGLVGLVLSQVGRDESETGTTAIALP